MENDADDLETSAAAGEAKLPEDATVVPSMDDNIIYKSVGIGVSDSGNNIEVFPRQVGERDSANIIENGGHPRGDPSSDHHDPSMLEVMRALLDPAPTRVELFRDELLRILDQGFFQVIGILVLLLVVVDGAIFFFFLMGWQTLCRPRTDCEPRNQVYNISVHILTGLFTYMVTVSMPWRCANFFHTSGWHYPRRDNKPGQDLYGLATMDIWFHIPRLKRLSVMVFLVWNCLFQYLNQVMRILYWSYDMQNEFPGNLMVTIFFGSSFLCAAIGACLMLVFAAQLRRDNPGKFGPGPWELAQQFWKKYVCRTRETEDAEKDAQYPVELCSSCDHPDPTRAQNGWEATKLDRAEMRLWGM